MTDEYEPLYRYMLSRADKLEEALASAIEMLNSYSDLVSEWSGSAVEVFELSDFYKDVK